MEPTLQILEQLYTDITQQRKHGLSRSLFRHLLSETLFHWRNCHGRCSKRENSVIPKLSSECTDGISAARKDTEEDTEFGESPAVRENETLHDQTEKCLQIHSGLCRKATLLMLTCIRETFEWGTDEMGTPKNGERETGMEMTFAVNSPEMVTNDVFSVIHNLIDDPDRFVRYAASKALIASSRCENLQTGKTSLLHDIVKMASCSAQCSTGALDIMKHFMSNRSGEQTNTWCFQALKSSQIFKKEFVEQSLNYNEIKTIDKPIALLTLTQKTVKYINKLDKDIKLEHLQELVCPIVEQLLGFLVKCLKNMNVSDWRILGKKTLDIFNTLFIYGGHLAQLKGSPEVYSQTASQVLSVLDPSLLMSIPYVCHFVGFGGIKIEGEDVENQTGDLALLRKLCLVLFKVCAIISKSRSTACLGRQQVSTCLANLPKLMIQVLPSPPVNFQWLPAVFADQDDAWVEALLCLLDVYLNFHRESATSQISSSTSPHPLFLQFMHSCSNDHMILVDLLTSPETCFLLYLLRYLKCVAAEWEQFTSACHNAFTHELSKVETVELLGSASTERSATSPASSPTETVMETNVDSYPSNKKMKLISACLDQKLNCRSADVKPDIKCSVMPQGSEDLVPLTAYSDSDSDPDLDLDSSAGGLVTLQPASESILPTFQHSCEKDIVESSATACKEVWDENSELPPESSTMSCDSQCVETVMDTLIRVRLRIEKLTEQELFPYNPDPLLSVLEHCETLYEQTGSDFGHL